jgi:hypothetical protein
MGNIAQPGRTSGVFGGIPQIQPGSRAEEPVEHRPTIIAPSRTRQPGQGALEGLNDEGTGR